MGKYGTNLEGFGAFEGGVNADKGAPLVSTSSDGETALLFGPAALREIQAGVANGDFAIPPDAAGDTITAENPLPYWTFTDVNSAGAITCAIVADADAGSGNVLKFTVASGTLTSKSATLTRYIPIASSASRSFSYYAEATFQNGTNSTQSGVKVDGDWYKSDGVTTTGTGFDSGQFAFSSFVSPLGVTAPNLYSGVPIGFATAPADAAYLKITITITTLATQSADRTIELTEVRVSNGVPEVLFTDRNDPTTYEPGVIFAQDGVLTIKPATSVKIEGENSNWVSRASVASAAQSLTNNTSTTILLDTASTTPTTGTYDPNSWFNNANDRIAIGQAGFYTVTANIAFAANATGRRIVEIRVNGSEVAATSVLASPTGSSIISATTNLYLAAGDLVTMNALQQSGGALNTVVIAGFYPALSVGRIGA